jgi:hypothetical protein
MPDTITAMEYTDADGLHIMCACGHYVSGGVKTGDKMALCPNCMFLAKFGHIPVVYPEQLPLEMFRPE